MGGHACVCVLITSPFLNTNVDIAAAVCQLEMPAYSRLREMGCPSTLANHWRSMRHRLRRRLDRHRGSGKDARSLRASKGAALKGPVQWRGFAYGVNEAVPPSHAETSAEMGEKAEATATEGGRGSPVGGERSEGDKSSEADGTSWPGEEDHVQIDDSDGDGGRNPKRARTQT